MTALAALRELVEAVASLEHAEGCWCHACWCGETPGLTHSGQCEAVSAAIDAAREVLAAEEKR